MARAFVPHIITDDSALGGSVIQRSLRFNDGDSPYLSRTPSSAGNRRTYTISVWAKVIDNGTFRTILGAGGGTTRDRLQIFDGDRIVFNVNDGSDGMLRTNRLVRDSSAWYHFVVGVDTTQATASNRFKLYVNGIQETSFETATYPSQNYDCRLNNNIETFIGQSSSNNFYFDGYIAEINLIDGTALDASYFGYTDFQTKLWRPKKYEGTYGTNGFRLDFSDNSGTTATTLGKDSSGNGNNFTPNNFSVATGSAVNIYNNDSSTDTPSENFATLNILHGLSYNTTFANGNLFANIPASNTYGKAFGDIVIKSGKWYWEVYYNQAGGNGNYLYVGLGDMVKGDDFIRAVRGSDGEKIPNTGGTEVRFATGDIINVAVDMDNGKWYIGRNGTYWYSGNPVAGTGFVHNDLLTGASTYGGLVPRFSNATGGATQQFSVNFGQKSFIYTPPTGYRKLNSNNIPVDATPSIIRPQKHFDTLTYTGNGSSSHRITGLEFQPDLVWIKGRSAGTNHIIQDVVRGNFILYPDSNQQEGATGGGWVKSFNSDGFTTDVNGPINTNSATYVAWCWKAGGAASSNSDGTITSSLSTNQEAGCSIITWTGTGSAGTIGHGLGKAPKLIIVKLRSGSQDWFVNNGMIFNDYGKYYKLNSSGSSNASDTNVFPNTAPTSTVFSVGTDGAVNASGSTYVAYVWSEIPGYSKFGFYTGNGNANGTFVHTGFSPRFIIYRKKSDENWHMFDTKRQPKNPNATVIDPNRGAAETTDTNTQIDILSNGFKLRSSHGTSNASGTDYFYWAWAEQPGTTPYDTETNAR